MAIANELNINTTATAMDMAQAIFGSGIQIVSATYNGDPASSGIYSGALGTIPGIVPSDGGVILSTGNVGDFTNSSGTTDTNVNAGTGQDVVGGVEGDTQLNAVSGQDTFDGAILTADFIPTGDMLTMQFVFSSEEYPEYVNGGVNDSFGVWVNGQFVEATISVAGNISIDSVNQNSNQNLYRDNTADQFNTEMDGFTYVLSFKAPVNAGQVNTIKIGIADGGDAVYDSNLLIMGDSIQTYALAMDDTVQLTPNSSRTFDILANDRDLGGTGLTITHLNGTAVVVGQTVTLSTGEQVRLNADGTVTVFSDGDLGTNTLNYSIVDGNGNTDVGFIFIETVASTGPDGIVQGTGGADVIDTSYLGDPDGDRIDNNDGQGVGGTTGDADYIMAGAGNDSIVANIGNDVIYAGTGDDTVFGGAGDDWADLGAGNDSFGTYGADSAGNDTVYGGIGNDSVIGGAGNDVLYGGTGRDTLSGGIGSDTLNGGADADQFDISNDHQGDTILGGESTTAGGSDNDVIAFSNFVGSDGVNVTFTGAEAGSYGYTGSSSGTTGSFSEIEGISGTANADQINAAANTANATYSGNAGNDSIIGGAGHETIYGGTGDDTVVTGSGDDLVDLGAGNDSLGGWTENDAGNDTISGGIGLDTINAGSGNDLVYGGDDNDMVYGSSGDDTLYGDAGDDRLYGGTGNDVVYAGAGNDTLQVVDSDQGETLFGGTGTDHVQFSSYSSAAGVNVTFTGAGAGNFAYAATPGAGSFAEVERFGLTEYGDSFDATASTSAVTVGAGGGADVIRGGMGADSLSGDADADTIHGGAGDTVVGGEGGTDNDTLVLNYADVQSITYGGGNNEAGTVTFHGGGTLSFSEIEHVVFAGPVDGLDSGEVMGPGYTDLNGDQIDGSDGLNDTIFGNGGDDEIHAGLGADLVYGGDGNDVLDGGPDAANDTVFGGAGNDSITGFGGDDSLIGDAGADTIWGGTGNDLVYGGDDNDLLQGEEGNDIFLAGAGNDISYGGDGDDVLWGNAGADTQYGGAGNDVLTGVDATGAYLMDGGTGDDTFYSGGFNDTVYGGDGNDLLEGVLYNNLGDDLLYAGAGDDTVNAGDGNDYVEGGQGQDSLSGGAGSDTIYGGLDNDTLSGDGGADWLDGGEGDDLVQGGAGNDTLTNGDGSDTLLGGDDADTFNVAVNAGNSSVVGGEGGTDHDTLNLSSSTNGVEVVFTGNEAGSASQGPATAEVVTFSEIEEIRLGGGNDTVDASATTGGVTLDSGAGNDAIIGGAGNDVIATGAGQDTVEGGAGNDELALGTDGDQDLIRLGDGDGADTLTGFESPADNGDGTYTGHDLLDVSGLTDASGNPVNVNDVTVSDDGNGNAVLSFPNGESLTLVGVPVTEVQSPAQLVALGIPPAPDLIVDGTGGDDVMSIGFTDVHGDQIDGTDGDNDTIMGYGGNDSITAGAGDDLAYGGTGNDTVHGLDGNDTLLGETGDDSLYGWAGDDSLSGGAGNDMVDGDTGNDSLSGGDGIDTVVGDEGNDTLDGGTAEDQLYGGADNDSITGGEGNDLAYGGDCDDTLIGDSAGMDSLPTSGVFSFGLFAINSGGMAIDNWVPYVTGSSTFNGSADVTMVSVTDDESAFEDYSGGGGSPVDGGAAQVLTAPVTITKIVSYSGGVPVYGQVTFPAGTPIFAIAQSDITNLTTGEAGNAWVIQIGYDNTNIFYGYDIAVHDGDQLNWVSDNGTGQSPIFADVTGLEYSDLVMADGQPASYNDTLYGGAGNDLIHGNLGDDRLEGEAGNDTIDGGSGHDSLDGGLGNDALSGGDGNDTVYAGWGDDTVYGGAGNDYLYADEGNDAVYGGAGNDTILTGPGDDTIMAGDGDDLVWGHGDNDLVHGDAGNDTLEGHDGDDSLYGGTGNDQLSGGTGADTLDGGDGHDDLYGGADNDSLSGGDGYDDLYGGDGDDLLDGGALADNLLGESGNDTLIGGAGADWLYAGTGDDSLDGGTEADFLYGDAGNDSLFGGSGNDVLYAGTGNDLLDGGDGNDHLEGADGNDTLTGGDGADTMLGGNDRDSFVGGIGDVVDGGEGGDDFDVLDLTAWGHPATNIIYDPMNPENGVVEFLDASGNVIGTMSFSNIESVVACFTPGAMILTDAGEVAVEDLIPGDRVLTRDNGYQTIRWVGDRTLTAAELAVEPRFNPVFIAKGALGAGLPEQDVLVSPQHRMLISGPKAELMFGEHEVLVAAKYLLGLAGIEQRVVKGVRYIHILFDNHEIVRADGAWSESFQPGAQTMEGMDEASRAEILALFPELAENADAFPAARLALKAREARVLMGI